MRAPSTEGGMKQDASSLVDLPDADRPTAALIDLEALDHNFREVVHRAGGRQVLAVVKAAAYGHGAVEISRRLLGLGADMLGVALVEEGSELRKAGIETPILVMGALFPEQAEAVVSMRLTPAVFTLPGARALSEAAVRLRMKVSAHVKIDTGMGRIGIAPEEAPRLIAQIRGLEGVEVRGLMTHFADADLCDKQFASQQMERFEKLLKTLDADARRAHRVPQEGPRRRADQLRTDVRYAAGKHSRDPADRVCRRLQPRPFQQGRGPCPRRSRTSRRQGVHGHVHDRRDPVGRVLRPARV